MSRIGKQPVTLPSGVTVSHNGDLLNVQGPKGTLEVPMVAGVGLETQDGIAMLTVQDDEHFAAQGLIRSLLQNAVTGVSTGWQKDLELHGVGMRAAMTGSGITLSLGFSHPVEVAAPQGIAFAVTKNVISVSGIDRQLVGEIAAQIRKLKKPEPYKGKGIRYSGEQVRRKAGKTGKAAK